MRNEATKIANRIFSRFKKHFKQIKLQAVKHEESSPCFNETNTQKKTPLISSPRIYLKVLLLLSRHQPPRNTFSADDLIWDDMHSTMFYTYVYYTQKE